MISTIKGKNVSIIGMGNANKIKNILGNDKLSVQELTQLFC